MIIVRWLTTLFVLLALWQWLHKPAVTMTGSEAYPAWLMGSWHGGRDITFTFQPEGKGEENNTIPFRWEAQSGVIQFSGTGGWLDEHRARYAMTEGGSALQLTWDDGNAEVYHQLP